MVTPSAEKTLTPNREFAGLADDGQIQRTVRALEAHRIHALVAENGEEARRMFFEIVPEGAKVFLGASVMLEKQGIRDVIDKSGRFDPGCSPWTARPRAARFASWSAHPISLPEVSTP